MNEQNINEQETTGGTQMPGFDGSEQPPTLDGSEQPPTLDGSEQPPTLDGSEQPPTLDGTESSEGTETEGQEASPFDGSQMPGFGRMRGNRGFGGMQQQGGFGGMQQQGGFGGMQQQGGFGGMQQQGGFGGMQQQGGFGSMQQQGGFGGMQPPQGNMWGNESFAGEDMLSSNNFAPGNFGAPSDLSGIVDTTDAEISVNIGEQNNFGNFAQDGMMFGNQGGQGMQFNQPQQNSRMQAR